MSDALSWLSEWYLAQCDSNWEHGHGITIETLDNPGWMLTVDLAGTALGKLPDQVVSRGGIPPSAENGNVAGSRRWHDAQVSNGRFTGACDPLGLGELVLVFRDFVRPR